MEESRNTNRLLEKLGEADRRLEGISLDDGLFAELSEVEIHLAHGVAGRIQDRVITILSRLTMEMASREDGKQG